MSRRAMTWLLWLAFVCTLPVPYFMIETGRIPTAQLMLFALLTAPLAVSDPSFTTRFVAGLFAGQSLLYGGLLYAAARLAAGALERAVPAPRRRLVLAAVGLGLAGAGLCFDLYLAPLSHGPGRTNLIGVFR